MSGATWGGKAGVFGFAAIVVCPAGKYIVVTHENGKELKTPRLEGPYQEV
jgi:hypothetical protein